MDQNEEGQSGMPRKHPVLRVEGMVCVRKPDLGPASLQAVSHLSADSAVPDSSACKRSVALKSLKKDWVSPKLP